MDSDVYVIVVVRYIGLACDFDISISGPTAASEVVTPMLIIFGGNLIVSATVPSDSVPFTSVASISGL